MKSTLTVILILFFLPFSKGNNRYTSNREVGMVQGLVVNDIDQTPIASADIILNGYSTQTNAEGQFVLEQIPVGNHILIVQKKGFATKKYPLSIEAQKRENLRIDLTVNALQLPEVLIKSDKAMSAASSTVLNLLDFQLRPINSAQDMLRNVSGLITAQHAGGGKAEQIFLRGFDADHGTDVAAFVDGIPVNMPSHGHGQGYLDLHFLIPETVKNVEVSKGTYQAELGNFATAGAVKFKTLDVLEKNLARIEATTIPTQRGFAGSRGLLMYQLKNSSKISSYLASEYIFSPSYFESPQDFKRFNIFLKNKFAISQNSSISLSASQFNSSWSASGQIPQRAISSGIISRFGSIDNTEGGNTSRQNINLIHSYIAKNQSLETQAYYSHYDFNLFSNFTFFKKDSINGDMIQQQDDRHIIGLNSKYIYSNEKMKWTAGGGVRYDAIDNNLSLAPKRVFESYLANAQIQETNAHFYIKNEYAVTPKLSAEIGMRFNYMNFNVLDLISQNALHDNYTGQNYQTQLAPKLNIRYSFSNNYKVFFNIGKGFHSNDARASVQDISHTLPKAWGSELGLQLRPLPNFFINAAVWGLALENELVFIGDEGTTENNGASHRIGLDIGIRAKIQEGLFFDADVNMSKGRLVEKMFGQVLPLDNIIPLAPNFTSTGGITWRSRIGIEGAIRYRFVGDRAANESNTVIAKGYNLLDMNCFYQKSKYKIGISLENILNTHWNEAQFDTESRLRNEVEPVSELHFTPGTPLAAKFIFEINF